MCPDVESRKNADSSAASGRPASQALRHVLNALGQAITPDGHSEPICAGYLALRSAAGNMTTEELFQLADKALGLSTRELVVNAYASRWCFMCSKGTVACESCDGSGRNDNGEMCSACNGLGIGLCGFCDGTGWAERETVPPEIRKEVLDRQLQVVRIGIRTLLEKQRHMTPQDTADLNEPARMRICAWLLRLQVRLRALAASGAVADESEKQVMLDAAQKIDGFLSIFRRRS